MQRLAADEELRAELREMTRELRGAWARVERTRGHRLRNVALGLTGVGLAAAWLARR